MLVSLLQTAILLAQIPQPSTAPQAAPATAPAVAQTAVTGAPATQPHSLEDTEVWKLIRGEKKLTPEQLLQLGYWVNTLKDLVLGVLGFIPKLFVAIIFFLVFWGIYRGIRKVVLGSMNKARVDQSIRDMLAHLLKWAIMGFGVVIACNQIGIQITALLTGVSIIGLAIGFAAQETLANFIAGIVIFWDRPFKVGDWVELDGVFGQVQRVTFRSTRILTMDGEVLIWPNTHMLANKLSNHSANPINRINIPIGIAYKASIDTARAALLACTDGDSRICKDPPPAVVVNQCADSSVNLVLRFWIEDESQERSMVYQYTEKAKNALDAAGIEIPFPHMQLFLEDTPALRALAADAKPPIPTPHKTLVG